MDRLKLRNWAGVKYRVRANLVNQCRDRYGIRLIFEMIKMRLRWRRRGEFETVAVSRRIKRASRCGAVALISSDLSSAE